MARGKRGFGFTVPKGFPVAVGHVSSGKLRCFFKTLRISVGKFPAKVLLKYKSLFLALVLFVTRKIHKFFERYSNSNLRHEIDRISGNIQLKFANVDLSIRQNVASFSVQRVLAQEQ